MAHAGVAWQKPRMRGRAETKVADPTTTLTFRRVSTMFRTTATAPPRRPPTRMKLAAAGIILDRLDRRRTHAAATTTAALEVAANDVMAAYRGGDNAAFDPTLLDVLGPVAGDLFGLFGAAPLLELDAMDVDNLFTELSIVPFAGSPRPSPSPLELLPLPAGVFTPLGRGTIGRGRPPAPPAVVAAAPVPAAAEIPAVILVIGDHCALAEVHSRKASWVIDGDELFDAPLSNGLNLSFGSKAVKRATAAAAAALTSSKPLFVVVTSHGVVTDRTAFVLVPVVHGKSKSTIATIASVDAVAAYVAALAPTASLVHFDCCFSSCGQPGVEPITVVTDTWKTASGMRAYGSEYALLSTESMAFFAASRAHFSAL